MHFERLLETLTQTVSSLRWRVQLRKRSWNTDWWWWRRVRQSWNTHTHTTVSGQPIGVFPNFLKYMRCTWSTKILFSKLYLKTPGLKIHGFCSSDLNTESHDSSHRNTEILTELDECVFIPVLNAAWILVHSKKYDSNNQSQENYHPDLEKQSQINIEILTSTQIKTSSSLLLFLKFTYRYRFSFHIYFDKKKKIISKNSPEIYCEYSINQTEFILIYEKSWRKCNNS